jgi:hypothetical protein
MAQQGAVLVLTPPSGLAFGSSGLEGSLVRPEDSVAAGLRSASHAIRGVAECAGGTSVPCSIYDLLMQRLRILHLFHRPRPSCLRGKGERHTHRYALVY